MPPGLKAKQPSEMSLSELIEAMISINDQYEKDPMNELNVNEYKNKVLEIKEEIDKRENYIKAGLASYNAHKERLVS